MDRSTSEDGTSRRSARRERRYYSDRSGKRPPRKGFTLLEFAPYFVACFEAFEEQGLFQEWLGYGCVDDGFVPGKAGANMDLFIFRALRKSSLWPVRDRVAHYTEDDLFDMVEFLYDHASKGVKGIYHQFNQCGWHYESFDKAAGQAEFRTAINDILAEYSDGFELSERGEIMSLGDDGLGQLLDASLPPSTPKNLADLVDGAKLKFLRRSTRSDRRDAVRDLADVLEYVRADAKAVLKSEDERDLFNIVNNFGIRHSNPRQKTDYDESVWLSWMFYHYLATIHACMRMIEKSKADQ